MSRRVHVVPHTHWDREWYLPFQSFRLRLVDVLDDLLPRMEADPSYARFLLDGQLAVVDDYLAVRPEAAEAIRRLVGSGRLSIGPWYTLPDEFLVSGETLVRNLQLGLRRAAHFGGAMQVGYLPDMFGHVAQMPQILLQLGFEDAVVWRGVPAAVDRSGFWWRAPDGSTVRAEYLPQGYGNGAALPDDAKALVAQVDEFAGMWDRLLDDAPVLWMNGTDHQAPQAWLGRVVDEANAIQDDYELVITSLPEHLATVPRDGLPTWDGELRSGARANVLMGVTSNRVDIRRAAARAERQLERLAEPLSALLLPAGRWPAALLEEAWRGVVRNAAHDSVCGCSVDEVCDAVLHRYAEATQIAEGLTQRALGQLARRIDHDGPVVVNPSARPRAGLVELVLPEDAAPPGTQLVAARPADQVVLEGPVSLVVPAAEEVNWDRSVEWFAVETTGGQVLVASDRAKGELITSGVRAALAAIDHPDDVRLRLRRRPQVTVLAHVDEVPGYGWTAWSPADAGPPAGTSTATTTTTATATPTTATATATTATTGGSTATVGGPAAGGQRGTPAPVRVEGPVIGNGLVDVEVDPATGTFSLNGCGGLGRLVDGGDCGDTYNWCPPADDTVVDAPASVTVETAEPGPLRGRLVIRSTYRWPERCEGLARRVGDVAHTVVTTLELRAGEPFLRVEVAIDNRSRDHRLRAHFPLPEPADRSRAECAFGVVERALTAEGGPTEVALPTYPARRFVQAGGLTVVHDGVTEYELVGAAPDPRRPHPGGLAPGGTQPSPSGRPLAAPPTGGPEPSGAAGELAITLLRCTGLLSQGPMTTRPLPAGPVIPTEGAQLLKPTTARFALAVGEVDPYALADEVLVPLQVVDPGRVSDRQPGSPGAPDTGPDAGPPLPHRGSALTVDGAEVSAVSRQGTGLRVRVVNPTAEPTTVSVAGRRGWVVDLRDRPVGPFEERMELRPWGIATLALTE